MAASPRDPYAGSLYDHAGGAPAFHRLAAAHHARCLADPVLEHPFSHSRPDHVERLAAYLAQVCGGPVSAEVGDHSQVLALHADNGIQADAGERFAACFAAALDDAGLPDDPAFRSALRSGMAAAVDEVMTVTPLGTTVPDGLPMPRWSFG